MPNTAFFLGIFRFFAHEAKVYPMKSDFSPLTNYKGA